jgi:hypothetical protein
MPGFRGIFPTRKNPGFPVNVRIRQIRVRLFEHRVFWGFLAFSSLAEGVVSITLTDPEIEELLPLRSG